VGEYSESDTTSTPATPANEDTPTEVVGGLIGRKVAKGKAKE